MKRFVALVLLSVMLLALMPVSRSSAANGVSVEYTVKVTPPEPAAMALTAIYRGASSSLRLTIALPSWPMGLDLIQELHFTTLSGQPLTYKAVDNWTVEVSAPADGTVVANWFLDLSRAGYRGKKVESFGGKLSGFEALLVPESQTVDAARIKFDLPPSWTLVSPYPQEGEWSTITALTFADLRQEIQGASWYFGAIDFDETKTYPDGFRVRLVGFKGQPYRHWNATMTDTPQEEALKVADVYHSAAMQMKSIMGEYPYPEHLIIGPDFWQGAGHIREQMRGVAEAEYIYHHVIHSYFVAVQPTRMLFGGAFYLNLVEGYATWAESVHTAAATGDYFWRGMLYERKFHYLRGKQFDNLGRNSVQYVTGPILVVMMDREIRKATGGKKTIDDLMATLWNRYKGPNQVTVTDEQVLGVLTGLTGEDWHDFYSRYVERTDNLDASALDAVKADWPAWVKATSDYWYDGHPSAHIVDLELVGSAGDQDMGVRWQPREWPLYQFVKEARQLTDISQSDLTEADVVTALNRITGQDHKDFFTFYRSQGLNVDVADISAFVRKPLFWDHDLDNAARISPDRWTLGARTDVTMEIVAPTFVSADEVWLQATVMDPPRGGGPLPGLVSGPGASYLHSILGVNGGQRGTIDQYFWRIAPQRVGGKTVAHFTVNLPRDAGFASYRLFARSRDGRTLDESSLTVRYREPTDAPPAPGFTDLEGYDWARGSIQSLSASGIIKGVAPDRYGPADSVTRAQFAALMQRVFQLPSPAQVSLFSDVKADDWEYSAVQAVAPYMPGVSDSQFAPARSFDRANVAAVLVKILSAQGRLVLLDAADARTVLAKVPDAGSIAPELQPFVATAIQNKILLGLPDGRFDPTGILTRAQTAVLLHRVQTDFPG
ncbi:MAG: S-layer homology domain-containing protein [Symbiobacteriia bacterium]